MVNIKKGSFTNRITLKIGKMRKSQDAVSYGIKNNKVFLQADTFCGMFYLDKKIAVINHASGGGHNNAMKLQFHKATYKVTISDALISQIYDLEESNKNRSNYNDDGTVTIFG